jgi:hypothetical protein
MNYYIWNKEDSVMGLSAQTLFASRPDFKYDFVIVIHKTDDKNNVVMMETMEGLREAYDIESTEPLVVGFLVSTILEDEEHETIHEHLEKIDEENEDNDDELLQYAKLLEDIIKNEIETQLDKLEEKDIPLADSYKDPACKVIDLSDVSDNVSLKKLQVVLKHAFVAESTDLTQLKCMESFVEELKELEDKREQYAHEGNYDAVELTTHKIETMKLDILDSCDATLKIDATQVHQYGNAVIIGCENGQSIIIDSNVLNSMRTSSIEYEKNDEGNKYRVHYKTVDVVLNECYNEVIERGNTVFVVSI